MDVGFVLPDDNGAQIQCSISEYGEERTFIFARSGVRRCRFFPAVRAGARSLPNPAPDRELRHRVVDPPRKPNQNASDDA
jgi:hypothetical protein